MKKRLCVLVVSILVVVRALGQVSDANHDPRDSWTNKAAYHGSITQNKDIYDLDSPLIFHNEDIIYRSVLSKFKYGWPYGAATFPSNLVTLDSLHKAKRVVMTNLPIAMLYIYAAYDLLIPRQTTEAIILEIKDTLKYCNPTTYPRKKAAMTDEEYLDWQTQNSYCYEIIVPDSLTNEAFSALMLDDLNRLFKVKGVVEKRKRTCYVLRNASKASKLLCAKTTKADIPSLMPNSGIIAKGFEDTSIDKIVTWLNEENLTYTFLNETSNVKPVDLYFNFHTTEFKIEEMRKGFEKYGFKIIKAKRKIRTLVLKDK